MPVAAAYAREEDSVIAVHRIKRVRDSIQIKIANGVEVYVWWKDKDTVRITATPVDFMYDITPAGVKEVKDYHY